MKHQFTSIGSLSLSLFLSVGLFHPIQSAEVEGKKGVQSREFAKYHGLKTSLGPFSLPNHGFVAV